MSNHKFLAVLSVLILVSCGGNENPEDQVNQVDKNGSVETVLSVQHSDSSDILVTKHRIWKNHRLLREIVKKDTIPALGDTVEVVEDGNGSFQQANIKKEYQFFITVQ